MSGSSHAADEAGRSQRWRSALYLAFLVLLGWLLYFHGASSAGFIGQDEPRYAEVSREMAQRGDPVTPYLLGKPWFEKPPLFYWMTAAGFRLFGARDPAAPAPIVSADRPAGPAPLVSAEAIARFPAALFAVAFVALFGWQTRRLFPGEAARYSAPMLLSSLGWIAFGRAASMEMLFASTLAAALGFMALWLWYGERRWLFAFHAFLALSVLAKGFGGVLLSALILAAYCAATREWRWMVRVLHPGAVTLFIVIAMPWMFAMYLRHGRLFFDEFIVKQHVRRVITNELAHPGPWWFYLPVLLAGLFPWTAHLSLLRWQALKQDQRRLFLFCWAAVVLLFFSVSLGKLPGYILVMLPAIAMWMGEEWKRATLRQIRAIGIAQAVMLVALSLWLSSLPIALSRGISHAQPHFTALSAYSAAGGLLLLWLCWRGRRFASTLAAAALTTAIMVWILTVNAPEIDRTASARPIAQSVCALPFGVSDLRRQLRYGLEFYCQRAMVDSTAMEYTLSTRAPEGSIAVRTFPESGLTLWRRQQ